MRSQEKSLLNLNLNHNQMRIPLHFLMTKSRIEATLLRPPECDRVTGWRDDAGDPTPVTTQTRPSQNIIGCFSSKLWRSDHYVSSTSNSVSLTTMFTTSEWQFCNQAVSTQHVCKHVCNQAVVTVSGAGSSSPRLIRQQTRDLNMSLVLISTVAMFLLCHTPRSVWVLSTPDCRVTGYTFLVDTRVQTLNYWELGRNAAHLFIRCVLVES